MIIITKRKGFTKKIYSTRKILSVQLNGCRLIKANFPQRSKFILHIFVTIVNNKKTPKIYQHKWGRGVQINLGNFKLRKYMHTNSF